MVKKYKYLFGLACVVLFTTSCHKFFDVQPEDQYTEEQVFGNENAIQQFMNGLYFNMASANLYGASLSTTTVELMAQRYNVTAANITGYPQLQQYTYTNATVMSIFDRIWTSAYANITKANLLMKGVEKAVGQNVISQSHADILHGEALAIRAMLHFDMLRLFGPVYATNAGDSSIPYYSQADGNTRPILPAKQIIDSVVADLTAAKQLLAQDPVISNGIVMNNDFYNGYRNLRFNYYAVSALQARVMLYGNNPTDAKQAALQALEGEKWFPWLPTDSINNNARPDRIFSTEMMFGIYDPAMYTNYTTYFAPELSVDNILTSFPARLTATFEGNENDYRYPSTWIVAGSDNIRKFFKYADPTDKTKSWRFNLPLIRKSEMYYILAETDATVARSRMDSVRRHRNLDPMSATAVIATEIQKEYQKEFFGEGQLFFYYKRTNKPTIPSAVSGTATIAMNATKYVVPKPLSETTPR